MSAAVAHSRTAMKRLAGVLSLVCLVLFLLAIEQKHTVAAVAAVRSEAGPAVRRVADWAAGLPSGEAGGVEGLATAVRGADGPLAAEPGPGSAPGGEYGPADEATRAAVGAVTFVGAELRFENGQHFRTRPLRVAFGREAFAPDQTFAARLNAPDDAQIELRQVVVPARGTAPAAPGLCGAERAGVVALLHRGDRVDLMLFRPGVLGAATPPSALCGVWSFTAR